MVCPTLGNIKFVCKPVKWQMKNVVDSIKLLLKKNLHPTSISHKSSSSFPFNLSGDLRFSAIQILTKDLHCHKKHVKKLAVCNFRFFYLFIQLD
jgi:hypothetical protein